jgi:hypothetical protein
MNSIIAMIHLVVGGELSAAHEHEHEEPDARAARHRSSAAAQPSSLAAPTFDPTLRT